MPLFPNPLQKILKNQRWTVDDVEIIQLIDRLRRAMPRNADVMALCDLVTLQQKQSNVTCPECERRREDAAKRVAKHRAAKRSMAEGLR